jgi:4-hydroxybenzoate polyprenyltransferase
MNATLRLMRFHKPVGTLLLWFPTAWALWLAYIGKPPVLQTLYFFLGTFFMRSAGCVLNDIADRNIDLHVERTKTRPLTCGEVSLPYAFFVLLTLLVLSFLILTQLPKICFYYALAALGITVFYPFCKRFFNAPQLILSIAFSMGIPMAYAAAGVKPNLIMALLFALNFSWILAYDTLYAMADKTYDLRIGVHSTAILFGHAGWIAIVLFLSITECLWLIIGWIQHLTYLFYCGWCAGLILLIIQNKQLRCAKNPNYIQAFSAHCYYGLIMWMSLIVSIPIA